jgi:nucleoid-associated protein YgaU
MSPTPIQAAGNGLVRAFLEIVRPTVPDPIVPVRFNPSEYQISKSNNFAEIPIPGLESPPIQFIRGGAEKLTTELLVDTSDSLEDVRVRYTDKLRALLKINGELHAPPIVRFTWDTQIFVGVLESLGVTFNLFSPDGVPLRARLSVALREYRTAEEQLNETPTFSNDLDKAYTVRRGDTLSSIAAALYQDPSQWRAIAHANGISDPRALVTGRVLTIPKVA